MENFYYFGAANSCEGFINNFKEISKEKGTFTYIIKGGAGTGKSTLMKKIGEYFSSKGSSIEYIFCSSDNDSLDGVKIVDKNVLILDGTSPHVTEPTMLGVKEKIIDLGQFISPKIKPFKDKIEQLMTKKRLCYKKAYAYLDIVKKIFEIEKLETNLSKTSSENLDDFFTKNIGKNIISEKYLKFSPSRKLFIKSIAKDGVFSLEKKNNFKTTIVLNEGNYLQNLNYLEELISIIEKNKIDFISFLSLFDTSKVESIFIPSKNLFITCEKDMNYGFKNEKIIKKYIEKAGKNIEKAKKIHKKIEKIYISFMDFENSNKLIKKIIENIEES